MRPKHVPLRTCIACRTKGPRTDFVRIVRSPDGDVRIDPPRNVPGRGAYLCRRIECWRAGLEGGRLAAALSGMISHESSAMLAAHARSEFGPE